VQPQPFTTMDKPTHFLSVDVRIGKHLGDVDSSLSRLIWPRETLYTELELEHIPPKNP